MRLVHTLVALALLGSACGQDEYGEGGGYGGEGYGEGGMPPPPPPPADLQELTSVEEFDAFIDNADASVIGALTAKEMKDPSASMPSDWDEEEDGPWEAPTVENPVLSSLKSISGSMYGFRFAYSFDEAVLAKMKAKSDSLFLYRAPKFVSKEHGDRPRERFPSTKLTEAAVSNWLNAKAQPLVGQYTHTTKDRYKSAVLVIFMNLDFEKNGQSVTYVLKRARKVAVGLKGKLSIAVAPLADMKYELEDYGLASKSETADILMGIRSGEDKYGAAGQPFNAKTLQAFADSFLGGELEPHVKPPYEPPADDADSDPDESEGDDDADKEEM